MSNIFCSSVLTNHVHWLAWDHLMTHPTSKEDGNQGLVDPTYPSYMQEQGSCS